jgi:hypothetical protein
MFQIELCCNCETINTTKGHLSKSKRFERLTPNSNKIKGYSLNIPFRGIWKLQIYPNGGSWRLHLCQFHCTRPDFGNTLSRIPLPGCTPPLWLAVAGLLVGEPPSCCRGGVPHQRSTPASRKCNRTHPNTRPHGSPHKRSDSLSCKKCTYSVHRP